MAAMLLMASLLGDPAPVDPALISEAARAGLAADAARPPSGPTMADRRARSEAIQQEIGRARMARDAVTMREATLAGVPVRVFEPQAGAHPGVILLNLHGGGFLVDAGSITEAAPLAALTGRQVISVRYRLAPEHPYPAGVEDALAVYRAIAAAHPDDRIVLFGTSAGASLAAQLVARLKHDGDALPAALGFFSGTADFAQWGDSLDLFGDRGAARAVIGAYLGERAAEDIEVSPLRGDLAGWPPTLCLSSSRDLLLSATAAFCRALDEAGAPATLIVFDGLPHAFWSYIDAPETDAAFRAMARHLSLTTEFRP